MKAIFIVVGKEDDIAIQTIQVGDTNQSLCIGLVLRKDERLVGVTEAAYIANRRIATGLIKKAVAISPYVREKEEPYGPYRIV